MGLLGRSVDMATIASNCLKFGPHLMDVVAAEMGRRLGSSRRQLWTLQWLRQLADGGGAMAGVAPLAIQFCLDISSDSGCWLQKLAIKLLWNNIAASYKRRWLCWMLMGLIPRTSQNCVFGGLVWSSIHFQRFEGRAPPWTAVPQTASSGQNSPNVVGHNAAATPRWTTASGNPAAHFQPEAVKLTFYRCSRIPNRFQGS